jgi:hypothetical protein
MILGIEKDLLSQMGLIERYAVQFHYFFLISREPNAEEVISAALLEPELAEFVLTGLSLTELPDDITKLGEKVKILELGMLCVSLFWQLSDCCRLQFLGNVACAIEFIPEFVPIISHC